MSRNNRGRGRRRGRGANNHRNGAAAGPPAGRRAGGFDPIHADLGNCWDWSSPSEDSDSDADFKPSILQMIGLLNSLEYKSKGRNFRHSTIGGTKPSILYTEDDIAVNTVYVNFLISEEVTEEKVRNKFTKFGVIKKIRIHSSLNNNPETAASSTMDANGEEEGAAAALPTHRQRGFRRGRGRFSNRIHQYAFVSFETCQEAAYCIHNSHKLDKECYVAIADSWHQEAYYKSQNEENGVHNAEGTSVPQAPTNGAEGEGSSPSSSGVEPSSTADTAVVQENSEVTKEGCSPEVTGNDSEGMSVLQLNDDCLMLIFEHFELMDLISLRKTCSRFAEIAREMYKRYKILDLDCEAPEKINLTMLDVKTILSEVGPFVDELHISMNRFNQPAVRILYLIPRHCVNLKDLNIDDFTLSAKKLQGLSTAFKALEGLTLSSCGIGDYVEKYLRLAKDLQRLDLSLNSQITGKCLRVVKNLKNVNLEGCQNLQGKPFSVFVENNKTVEYLNITDCNRLSSDAIKSMVSHLGELNHLICSSSYENAEPSTVALLANLPKLKRLQIKVNSFSSIDPLMNSLAETNRLEYLDLYGNYAAFDYNVLGKLTNLKTLIMNHKLDFVDEHLAKLCTNGNFVELHIAGCTQITEKQLIAFIRANPLLTRLDISSCNISEGLVFSAVDILKEQANGTGRVLTLVVGKTSICTVIMDNALIISHRHLLNISFESTEGFYSSMDDDMYDDMMDDEDFMGYDFDDADDDDYWGIDLEDIPDMCHIFYDSDDHEYGYIFDDLF
ncbi:uncharacterized protein LOC129747314 [Uranotaenia lowii]|uniref:uncharacterized protein LOC129747314 n=1 Tax=Uranotaenia lowii TaxID=190385 RepID=UPI00247AF166|nr:uncharacterized protein LOC129747314 [Uranotaenia lowii]XP_055597440.1 uncharacterized protein LOC129747314 [Uranotaenia lowii]